ncbi:MAG TPA: ADOP family duplicated permease [Terriglobales bacterium]|nr:ADOP family duplicated permease [Terriglobales bacterium]
MNSLLHDAQYGMRQLRRNPGFTATVIVTLALSIGANTAIFSIVNALLLKSLPYSHPERMGTIYTRMRGSVTSDERHHIDGEQWELLRDDVPALISAISSIRPSGTSSGVNLQGASRSQYVAGGRISAHYLDVLEIRPIVGRNFSETEDVPGGAKAAILSYNLWRNAFGSKRDILGQTILLKGAPYTVIGVLPEGVTMPLSADVYTALQESRTGEGAGTNFECITRLRDGATWQEADAEINRAWGSRPGRYELQDDPSGEISYYSVPLQKGETDPLRPQVLTLMLAAGLILLIACANLAGLTLVRVLRRTPEIATRLALGASPWRVQEQLWIENLVLALAGGVAGVAVGFFALRGLLLLLPEHFLPIADVSLDNRVLAFTAFASLFTSVLFGMLPTLTTRKFDLRAAMGSRQTTGGERLRSRQALMAGEVALTVVLLAAAGLLVRTLVHLETLPPGFNPDGVMAARASLDEVRFHDDAAFRKLLDESTAAMRRIPGVQTAAVGLALPYERTVNEGGITIDDGREKGEQIVSGLVYVTPDYFSALQIPLVAGRYFTDSDGPATQHVAIINQTFMRKFFHGENPIGRHLLKDIVIVGIVRDVAMKPSLGAIAPLTAEQTMYVPAMQVPARRLTLTHMWFQPSWIVRTSRPIEGLTAQMQRALASVDPDLPFSGFYSMQDLRAKALVMQHVEVALLSTMAALALLLSAVGIFALVANMVTQKTREIGIRMALGSTVREAIVHVGVPGLRASTIGLVIGLVLCAGVLRIMKSVLFGVTVYDMPAIASAVAVFIFVAIIASSLPTLRIAGISPADTLRED